MMDDPTQTDQTVVATPPSPPVQPGTATTDADPRNPNPLSQAAQTEPPVSEPAVPMTSIEFEALQQRIAALEDDAAFLRKLFGWPTNPHA